LNTKAILVDAKNCLNDARTSAYPQDFTVNPWWAEFAKKSFELTNKIETAEQAVLYAQSIPPFDHRKSQMRGVIEFKLREIERLFPGFLFHEHPELSESTFSDPASLEVVDGVAYSNIFLYHTNFYLRSTASLRSEAVIKKVIEIGTGYGGLARIFKTMNPKISYTLIDLPECLFFAHIYLLLNFPTAKILYLNEENKHRIDEPFDFILVPVQRSPLLVGQSYDLAINTGSFQEMDTDSLTYWMNFLEQQVQVKEFYSCNYFMTLSHPENTGAANLLCPILDSFWKVRYFKINPDVITVDSTGRNWLEIRLERIPAEKRDFDSLENIALSLLEKSRRQPKGSNDWFENIWMSIWCYPNRDSVSEMLHGIQTFKLGIGAQNRERLDMIVTPYGLYARKRPRLISLLRVNKEFVVWCLRRGSQAVLNLIPGKPFLNRREYSGETYYRNLLSGL